MNIKKIILYDEPSIPEIKISDLASFIKDNFSVDVVINDNFFLDLNKSEVKLLTKTRMFDIYKQKICMIQKNMLLILKSNYAKIL